MNDIDYPIFGAEMATLSWQANPQLWIRVLIPPSSLSTLRSKRLSRGNMKSPQWLCGNSCTWAHDVVITGRAYCFHDNIYITLILLLWDLSNLCVVDHLWHTFCLPMFSNMMEKLYCNLKFPLFLWINFSMIMKDQNWCTSWRAKFLR